MTEIDDPARIPEIVSRAFYTATSGRPGPVVMALPEDMLTERVAVPDAPAVRAGRDLAGPRRHGEAAEAALGGEAADRDGRRQPLVGGRVRARWRASPSASTCRSPPRSAARHLIDSAHPSYAGDLGIGPNPKLLARIKAADLIVLIGGRLGEMPSQSYTLLDIPGPRQTFVHVHPGAEELGRVYRPHLAINAAPTGFAAALEGLQPPNEIAWRAQTKAAHADYLAWTEKATPQPGAVNFGEIMVWLRQHLPETPSSPTAPAISPPGCIASSASANSPPTSRRPPARWATACRRRSASSALYPERTVVCFAGDGDFLMNGQEFATAVQYDLPIIVVIWTTASTAPSACTRSANIPTAWSAPS